MELYIAVWFLCILLPLTANAQDKSAAIVDPLEVKALNSMLLKWGIASTSEWNVSAGACKVGLELWTNGVRCDCSYENDTVCHIISFGLAGKDITGTIPEELKQLKYLQNLFLDRNYLTGPLPAFIGTFSDMAYLSVVLNSLSGSIPKEIGNLTKLLLLSIHDNNFSGVLPPELGGMTSLREFYAHHAGIGGEIPSTFSELRNLTTFVLVDNDFTGKIPDFIGGWTKLKDLRLHGNSFQGPIPSSFANLSGLEKLYIGEINGTSSLAFIKNMTQLDTLVIRNSMISDTLPDFVNFKKLQHLDFSFNNISGSIPQSLFNSPSLESLLLGNNSLWGSLPRKKNDGLNTIDLSYNKLSGSFPSWAFNRNLDLNLVANNFSEEDLSRAIYLPSGLNCLQQGINCRNSYSEFAINCGGKEVVAIDGTVYTSDETDLHSALSYMNDGQTWAVSNVGVFSTVFGVLRDFQPTIYNKTEVVIGNASDVKLFKDLRFSASSLRYYGLGLQSGSYNVTLLFIESTFSNNKSWKSLGRRVFDIYIQGELMEKNFDIRKQAGGVIDSVVMREYSTLVTDGFLEIHLFWAGKGTTEIPVWGNYGPSIAALGVKPNFKPTKRRPSGQRKALVAGIASVTIILLLLVIGIIFWLRQKGKETELDREFQALAIQSNYFSYSELRSATADFCPSNKLGEGGFGAVYKGKLPDGRLVAVKQLSLASEHGLKQFAAEIATISAVQHRNLVKLIGYCYKGGNRKLLVYEYLEKKSLDLFLFGMNEIHIDWPTRFKICLGTARGLAYLHEESRLRIIHRDIKAANILLDGELNPKISDFGLAKLFGDNMTHVSTKIAGTMGYLAPEYATRGRLTEKADVFSFGVLSLEIVCGRSSLIPGLDEDETFLPDWASRMHMERGDLKLVDRSLQTFNEEEVIRVIRIALLCTQAAPELRPTMTQVVGMLVGDFEVNEVKQVAGYSANLLVGRDSDLYPNNSSASASDQPSTSAGQSSVVPLPTLAKESFPILKGG